MVGTDSQYGFAFSRLLLTRKSVSGLGGKYTSTLSIDMVNFQHFSMDKETWFATIGAGARLGEVDAKLHANGDRAFPHGVCPDIGLGGHATVVRLALLFFGFLC